MKKTWIALVLVLVLLLTACGKEVAQSDVAGTIETIATTATEAPAEAGTVEVATEPAVEEPFEETDEDSAAAEAPEGKTVTMGRIEGGKYINEYAGYACELDSNWVFHGAEELQQLPENVKELLADSEMADLMEGVVQFTDMFAENVNDLANVNVLYQKMSMQERLAFSLLSDDEILDEVLLNKDMMVDAYAQIGMNVESIEKGTVTFLGEERTALLTKGDVQGAPYWQVQVFDYHLGQYCVTLTVSSYLEDKTADVLNLFYPVQ